MFVKILMFAAYGAAGFMVANSTAVTDWTGIASGLGFLLMAFLLDGAVRDRGVLRIRLNDDGTWDVGEVDVSVKPQD